MSNTQDEQRRRGAWIERASSALRPHGPADLHDAIVNLARCFQASGVMTLDVRLRPFMSTSFPGCVVVTSADPDLKDVVGRARVGAGAPLQAVSGADMGECAGDALAALVEELGKRA